ncbi:hypothetical protein [Winogradskyella sp. A3E31]|uniref:hypothetical protein n=1 Tax=Winogradskyella sp. A3E31 TaxID=3349637 RepID=UPI00398A93CD
MKTLVVFAIAFCTLTATAQEKKRNWEDYKKERGLDSKGKINPKDRAELESKKLTLALDLSEDQQEKVEDLLLTHFTKAEAKRKQASKDRKKLSEEEKLAIRKERLDTQIALKKEMKTILSADQYAKYEKMQGRRHQRGMKKMKEVKQKQRR